MTTYHVFAELSKTESSVCMRMANFFFDKKIEDIPDELSKMKEIAGSKIQSFHRDPEIIVRHAVNQNVGVIDSYAYLAPVVDTDAYMVCAISFCNIEIQARYDYFSAGLAKESCRQEGSTSCHQSRIRRLARL